MVKIIVLGNSYKKNRGKVFRGKTSSGSNLKPISTWGWWWRWRLSLRYFPHLALHLSVILLGC